jgi:hypothetical protein
VVFGHGHSLPALGEQPSQQQTREQQLAPSREPARTVPATAAVKQL